MHHMYLFSNLNETALKQTEILQGFKSNKKKKRSYFKHLRTRNRKPTEETETDLTSLTQ